MKTRSTFVDLIVPGKRARAALGNIRFANFVEAPRDSVRRAMAVASLADLDGVAGRHSLMALHRMLDDETPLVLVSERARTGGDAAAFQAIAHLTWLIGREVYVAPDAAAVARMVFARQVKAEKKLIASATVEGHELTVWSCEPRRYSVHASEIPALARLSAKALAAFELSETGSRIRWGDGEIDLDVGAIVSYADPKVRRKYEAQNRKEAARYAGAIGELRARYGIKQNAIEGLSERQVRRLEQGDTLPHSSTLAKLAEAHGLSVETYLQELAKHGRENVKSYAKTRRRRV